VENFCIRPSVAGGFLLLSCAVACSDSANPTSPNAAAGAADTAGASALGGAAGVPGQLSNLQFYGRWDLTQQGKAVTVNSGSHVSARFKGTGISAKFDTSGNTGQIPTVTIEIDDANVVEKEISATLELASGLTAGMHDVTLYVRGMNEQDARWFPPLVASTVFLGFTVAGGYTVQTPRPEGMKMEFLGDSITEGVFMHVIGPRGQTTENWRTDGPRGYAALTAMKLGAEWRQVGFGGQGLSKGGHGGVPKAPDAFNWVYAGVARDAWQADVVVINQGTNDLSLTGAAFAPLYAAYLGEIRTAYPAAKIVALRPFDGAFGSEIQAQVQARNTGGDAKVFYIDTAGWTAPADFTDGLHPTQAGGVKITSLLVGALMPLLN
jgi:lysophospholipase L1-like esterase